MKVGDNVRGELNNAPHICCVGGRKVKNDVNRFEGVIVEIKSAETSNVGEELFLVKYTKPSLWSKIHRAIQDWYFASELS